MHFVCGIKTTCEYNEHHMCRLNTTRVLTENNMCADICRQKKTPE